MVEPYCRRMTINKNLRVVVCLLTRREFLASILAILMITVVPDCLWPAPDQYISIEELAAT
jgi:hypothetical protein